ncbi:hypothetical protein GGR54DRAFT_72330 [Hypoxylon sp. NC1633]|nr:hypothetical protein GGR54DRAFT_72330 [Hypoxylon sp. NC1633]
MRVADLALRSATVLAALAPASLGLAVPAPAPAEAPTPTVAAAHAVAACTTGVPVVTAGYTINYAPALPTAIFDTGYQPEPVWAKAHVVGTYTFGVPQPVESGFAFAQFKCQYYCNGGPSAAGFFVNYAGEQSNVGSMSSCTCYDDLLAPESFISDNMTLVGAWNHICVA